MSKYQEAVEQVQLAQTYFEDGAPYSAARCLEKAGLLMRQHANNTNPLGPQPSTVEQERADLDIAIGEHAFRAGYDAAAQRAVNFAPTVVRDWAAAREQAWSEYTPPEDLCGH